MAWVSASMACPFDRRLLACHLLFSGSMREHTTNWRVCAVLQRTGLSCLTPRRDILQDAQITLRLRRRYGLGGLQAGRGARTYGRATGGAVADGVAWG